MEQSLILAQERQLILKTAPFRYDFLSRQNNMAIIHYRLLSRATPTININPLDSALRTIMATMINGHRLDMDVRNRMQDNPDGHKVALNTYYDKPDKNWFFAEFLRMEPGGTFRTVQDGGGQVFKILEHQVNGNETPLKGVLYVLVCGDNVLFTGKERFSSRCLEGYLDWILKLDSNVLAQDRQLILKTAQFDSNLLRANSANLRLTPFEEDYLAQQVKGGGKIKEILKVLGLSRQDIHVLVDEGRLDMDIMLKFKNGGRKRDISIGDIEHIVRNVDDLQDVTYKGPDGKVNRLITRLEGNQDIESVGSFYNLTDARNKLLTQFYEWQNLGYMSGGE